MDTKDTRVLANRLREDAGLLRAIIEKETAVARMLVEHEYHAELAAIMEDIEKDISIAEVKWRYFAKVGFGNNKMAVVK